MIDEILDEAFPGSELYWRLEILSGGGNQQVYIPMLELEVYFLPWLITPEYECRIWEKREGRYVRIK